VPKPLNVHVPDLFGVHSGQTLQQDDRSTAGQLFGVCSGQLHSRMTSPQQDSSLGSTQDKTPQQDDKSTAGQFFGVHSSAVGWRLALQKKKRKWTRRSMDPSIQTRTNRSTQVDKNKWTDENGKL